MKTTSAPVMVIFFENGVLNLFTARFKVHPQQIRGTLPTAFSKILYNFLFYEHGSTCALNLSPRLSVNVTETRIDEGAWKKIVTQNVHLEEHCTKIETTFHLIYAPLYLTNLVFKFNAVLVGFFFFFWCQPQCTYLPFDYHLIYHWS